MGYGFKAQSGGKFGGKKAGKLQLPGQIFEEEEGRGQASFQKEERWLEEQDVGSSHRILRDKYRHGN